MGTRQKSTRFEFIGYASSAALIVLALVSWLRVLNLEIHLKESYEFGMGGGCVYFARLDPFFIRPPRPTGWGIRVGEDHWEYQPWNARFFFSIPTSVLFCLTFGPAFAFSYRRRVLAAQTLRKSERMQSRIARATALFPFALVPSFVIAAGVVTVFAGRSWPQSDIAIVAFATVAGIMTFLMLRFADMKLMPIENDCGHCASCGYDLTGNESGRCPECGSTTPSQRASPPPNRAESPQIR
ncbi:MAG: hypothetical protein AMXMBFR47_37930 [Planctomycetota bacterium]